MADTVFIKGMIVKKPSEKAPDFIKANISFKVDEIVQFLQEHAKNGWVNVQVKESKGGKYYAQVDTWERKTTEAEDREYDRKADAEGSEEITPDDIPY